MSDREKLLKGLKIDRTSLQPPGLLGYTAWAAGISGALFILFLIYFFYTRGLAVQTALVEEISGTNQQAQTVLEASGYVIARRRATVSSKVTGKVMSVDIEEGMLVESGQVLAKLDDQQTKTQLALATAQVAATQAQIKELEVQIMQAEADVKRMEALAEKGLVPVRDLDVARSDYNILTARKQTQVKQVAVASESMALQKQFLADTIIRAPFAGVVVSKDAQPGEMISPVSAGGGFTRTGICTIVDMDSLEIEVDVNENYLNRVSENQEVDATLNAYTSWTIPAHVIAIIPTADRQKATVKIRVGFKVKDSRILPDMGVKVRFLENQVGAEKTVVTRSWRFPSNAVIREGARDFIYVVNEDKLEKRLVQVIETKDQFVSVRGGASKGEHVVINPDAALIDGQKVRLAN